MKEMQVIMYVSDDGKVKDTNKKEVEDYEFRNKVVDLLPRKSIALSELCDIIGDYSKVNVEVYKLNNEDEFNSLCKYFSYKTVYSKYNPNCKFYIIDTMGIYSKNDFVGNQTIDKNNYLDRITDNYEENIESIYNAMEQLGWGD